MSPIRLRLPATSANLGPGFDTIALALELFLAIEAEPAAEFSIEARGRSAERSSSLKNHLLIETYRSVLTAAGKQITPLRLGLENAIPLGMGCGSSAAVRLGGVALAAHFGGLNWDGRRIVSEAAAREGHPDNVAACWYGGLTIAAGAGADLATATLAPPENWRALLVLPAEPVATEKARSVLPENYPRADAVANLQSLALLVAAFATSRPELMQMATRDRLHQPYRGALCPMLPALLPMAGHDGVLSVTLSGAGPAVLLLIEDRDAVQGKEAEAAVASRRRAGILERTRSMGPIELLELRLLADGVDLGSNSQPTDREYGDRGWRL